jgi:hypothetical protein
MKDHNHTGANGQDSSALESRELEHFGQEEVKNNDIVGKAATIVVVGVGVALISTELIPGMIIGVAAALLPGIGPKLKPLFKSTVKASYAAIRKTREMVAEASEQVQDVVAEARADHAAESSGPKVS